MTEDRLIDRSTQFTPSRAWFLVLAMLWTGIGEEFASGGWMFWYGTEVRGVPGHYLILGATLLLISPFVFSTPRVSLVRRMKATSLWSWISLAWAALLISLLRAILTSAPEPFADWRNLAVVGVVAAVATRWLFHQPWRRWIVCDLAVGYGVIAVAYLIWVSAGGGTSVIGVRTPTFFGPLLFMQIFASITLTVVWVTSLQIHSSWYRWLVRIGAVSSTLLVVFSFRRSFWLAWGLGVAGVMHLLLRSRWARPRRVGALVIAFTICVIAGFVYLGAENVAERLESFLPSSDNQFSATNEDHFNDLRDALTIIAPDPILGYGIGRRYQTNLIADWKLESFEVHNAVLHVWLKFGLLGAIAYVGFHVRFIRSLWVEGMKSRPGGPLLAVAAIYVAAESIATLVGTWPYGSIQMSIFHALLIAALAVAVPRQDELQIAEQTVAAGIAR